MNPYYYVLGNGQLFNILFVTIKAAFFATFVFLGFAARNPSSTLKKGNFAKIVPWLLLVLVFISFGVTIYELDECSSNGDPQPDALSITQQMNYGYCSDVVYGWANADQNGFVNWLSFTVFVYFWMIYSFNYVPSDTTWWKKLFKFIAYALLSLLILGFSFHSWRDILAYCFFVVPAAILLILARVKPKKAEEPAVTQPVPAEEKPVELAKVVQTQDPSRFMPPAFTPELEQQTSTTAKHYCKHCGKEIDSDAAFCKYCGKRQ